MTEAILCTSLHDWHVANGGRMVDFAGWSMPVQYRGIVSEHTATRTSATLFDVSHMGRLRFSGADVESVLDRISTRGISKFKPGRIRYSLVCREDGGILDDVLIYYLADSSGTAGYSMVVNASNRAKIVDWLLQQSAGLDFQIDDTTESTTMIAVQGPRALGLVSDWLGWDPSQLSYYTGASCEYRGESLVVSRTGYTGEDGVELVVGNDLGPAVWEELLAAGASHGVCAAGLGARDTLRLEAAMPLYGHELGESISAAQTGLDFAIKMSEHEFIGKGAIQSARESGGLACRVGLRLEGKRPAREGAVVKLDSQRVGEVTSGTFSPTLSAPIAMAYVAEEASALGTGLVVEIRGSEHRAEVVALPFYQR